MSLIRRMKKMPICSDCVEVQTILHIDIERLIQDLGIQKGNNLADQEQRYLCLSLLGNTPMEIAQLDYYDRCRYDVRQNNPNLTAEEQEAKVKQELRRKADQNIRPYLSTTINGYVKNLIGVEKMPSWSKVMYFFRQKGYTMIDLAGTSKRTTIKIRLGGQPSDMSIVDLLRRLNNPNLSVVFQELKGDEQND